MSGQFGAQFGVDRGLTGASAPLFFNRAFGSVIYPGQTYFSLLEGKNPFTVKQDSNGSIDGLRDGESFGGHRLEAKGEFLEIKAALTTGAPLFATGTSYSATSGSIPVLLPTYVDQKLYDVTRRKTPLASGLIPRVANNGLFADYVKRTAVPTFATAGSSTVSWSSEAPSASPGISTYTRTAQAVKFLYAFGEVTYPMIVASKVWHDALQAEIEGQYKAVKYLEEQTIISGDTSAALYTNGFQGLRTLITTNSTAKAGATIAIDDLDTAFSTIRQTYYGEPDLIVTDWKTYYDLKKILRDYIRYPSPDGTLSWGFEAMEYENVPIVPDQFMPSTGSGRVLLVLTVKQENNIQLRVLQDTTFEELAKTTDSYKFMIKLYETMILIQESWCYQYTGLA